jgi:pimeloyl-ACP methyl ester carboxylesterase
VRERLDALVPPREPIHVAGHSYGGLVALLLAARKVRPIASLALYEPVAMRLLDARERAPFEQLGDGAARLVYEGAERDAARLFVDFWSGEGSFERLPLERQQALGQRVAKIPLDFAAAGGWPLDPATVRGVNVPTLLMVGNRGLAIVQRVVDRLAHLLPDVRVTRFDAGHMGPVTHPDRVNPRIEAFVDRCTRTPLGPLERALKLAPWRSQGASPAM